MSLSAQRLQPPLAGLSTVFALALACVCTATEIYFPDWGSLGGRGHEPTCVDIPKNLSLCSGISYNMMRLPNLLDHDTLQEVQQQAGSWVPLLNVRCHPDTQLFLCSLFTPVCLDSPIFPCYSLCKDVQTGCEERMKIYGYQWPQMLQCDRFPQDNGMCIKGQYGKKTPEEVIADSDCPACSPADTYENILDNFCRSDFVIRARIKQQRGMALVTRKARVYKSFGDGEGNKRDAVKKLRLHLADESACCKIPPSSSRYLIMGRKQGSKLIPTFILPWLKLKSFRQAVKMFRKIDCSDPKLFSIDDAGDVQPHDASDRKKHRSRNGRRMRKILKQRRRRRRRNNITEADSGEKNEDMGGQSNMDQNSDRTARRKQRRLNWRKLGKQARRKKGKQSDRKPLINDGLRN